MTNSKLDTAKKLAKAHMRVDRNVRQVYLLEPVLEDNPDEPIKLLEIVKGTLERGVEPVGFARDPERGINFPFWIVELSPREYKGIQKKTLHFQDKEWTVGMELAAR